MRIADLDLPSRAKEAFAAAGYDALWPSQELAAPAAAAGENLVLAVPTASGKSLVAYVALLARAARGGRGVYIVPLRALASEKFDDLRALAEPMGLKVGLAMGDLDAGDPRVLRNDIVVCTSEKADAMLRHNRDWVTQVACVVADEVHLLGEPDRGPTLEVLLARFRQLNPTCQLVALSATIQNSAEIARWLNAKHFRSDWRPVELKEGTLYGRAVTFTRGDQVEVDSDNEEPTLALAEDAVKKGGQVLVFVNNRKSTEAAADKLAQVLGPLLDAATAARLKAAAQEIAKDEDGATSVEKRLARAVKGGAAFHHAGLKNRERGIVERAFKDGLIKAIAATPTLAAGVNLPARRVIVRDLHRYDVNEGNVPIPVMEYKQMAGRAGRPKYDKVGEAVTIAKSYDQRSQILLDYILAEPENVTSKLGTETALRTHVLATIAAGFVEDEPGLREFAKNTFYAEQNDLWTIETRITAVLDFLLEHEFIESAGDELKPTRYGKRVSELYIDPASAVKLRAALDRVTADRKVATIGWLHAACATPDVRALFLRRNDDWVEAEVASREEEFLLPPPKGLDYEWFLAEAKTAFLVEDWIEEAREEDLLKKYGAYPGDVRAKAEAVEWLLYATQEIARLFKKPVQKEISRLTTRVHHGAKEELLPLLAFRGVGRVRARALWRAGLRTRKELAAAPLDDLKRVPGVGPTVAASIKRELGEQPEAEPADEVVEKRPVTRDAQTTLGGWD